MAVALAQPSLGWSIREKLCLAAAVNKLGENAWTSVAKLMKTMAHEEDRPDAFYNDKSCAKEFSNLMEKRIAPKKRRSEASAQVTGTAGTSEQPASQILSTLTMERIEELKKIISHENQQFKKMKREIEMLVNGQVDHQVPYMEEQAIRDFQLAGLSEDDPEYLEILEEVTAAYESSKVSSVSEKERKEAGEKEDSNTPPETESPIPADNESTLPSGIGQDSKSGEVPPVTSSPPPIFEEENEEESELIAQSAVKKSDNKVKKEGKLKDKIPSPSQESSKKEKKVATETSPMTKTPPSDPLKLRISLTKNEVVSSTSPIKEKSSKDKKKGASGNVEEEGEGEVRERKLRHSPKKKDNTPITTPVHSPTRRKDKSEGDLSPQPSPVKSPRSSGRLSSKKESEEPPTPTPTSPTSTVSTPSRRSERRKDTQETKSPTQKSPSKAKRQNSNPIPPSTPTSSITAMKHCPPPQHKNDAEQKLWKQRILTIWRAVSGHRHANLFITPVTDKIAENYSSIVKQPMDLGTLKKQVENGTVTSTLQFKRALLVMFANAVMYNHSDHDVNQMAKQMAEETMETIEKMMNPDLNAAEVAKSRRSGRFQPSSETIQPPSSPHSAVSTPRESVERDIRKRPGDSVDETPPTKRSKRQ